MTSEKTVPGRGPGIKSPAELWKATVYSLRGLAAAVRDEKAFRTEIALALAALVTVFFLDVSRLERAVMIYAVLNVLVAELVNTAVEAVVDRVSTERHPLSAKAKDVASAVVFVSIAAAAAVWAVIIFG